jgi:DNA-binding response OmpR family regulator
MRQKILVVEDDPDLVDLISFNLTQAGFTVGTALDGVDGLEKARCSAPDLILLDLMLPGLDGFAICDILRRDPRTAAIPIIIVTAMTSQLTRFNGLDSGAKDFITKPFSPRHLLSRIREILTAVPKPV